MLDELGRKFARSHGCPPGCEACAAAMAELGVPDVLARWEAFVMSKDAYRLVHHCERAHVSLPRFSPDDVVQFCIEEALFERLAFSKLGSVSGHFAPEEPSETFSEGGNPAHEAAMAQARDFAAQGTGMRR